MGGMSDMWIGEFERIIDEYQSGKIEHDAAINRLKRLGLDPQEIQDQLDEADK